MSTKPKRKVTILESKIGNRNALGLWQEKNKGAATISIDSRLKGFQRLMIITHEALHEICPDWSEDKVRHSSEILAGILWKCDYRHVDHAGTDAPNYKKPSNKNKTKIVKIYEKKAKIGKVRVSNSNKTLD
jgi:hypothetical protein